MKFTKTQLKEMVRKVIREQLDTSATDVGPTTYQNSYDTDPNDPYVNVKQLFQYIEQHLQDGQYDMAKKFVDNLKNEVEKMERRSFGFRFAGVHEQTQVKNMQPRQQNQTQTTQQQQGQGQQGGQTAQQQSPDPQNQQPISKQQQLMQQIDQNLKAVSADTNKLSAILQFIQSQAKA